MPEAINPIKPLTPAEKQLVRDLWKKHGGEQHGPITETMTIPAHKFYAFMAEWTMMICEFIDIAQQEQKNDIDKA